MDRLHRAQLVALVAAAALAACDHPVAPLAPGLNAAATPLPPLTLAAGPIPYDVPPYSATPAPEWDTLFHRSSGWTGADAAYALPLSGDYRPGSADATKTVWIFDDTFIGNVDASGHRLPGTTLVNNTFGVLTGGQPLLDHIQFFWRTDAAGNPQAQVQPNTNPTHWFWPNDGIALGGTVYLYALEMAPGTGGVFNFQVVGVSLLTEPASSPVPFATYTQTNNTPLLLNGPSHRYFGQAVMPNTVSAGAPYPDGYLYVYGTRNDPYDKKLLVARVLAGAIADFAQYQFWDGRRWQKAIGKSAPLTDRISAEFSVSPLADGRFLLVFQLDGLGRDVAVRYGASPVGPWGNYIPVYHTPEPDIDPSNVYTYNAKGHPHLSQPGELLISYNVNTFSFTENMNNANIYRPRFVHLPLP